MVLPSVQWHSLASPMKQALLSWSHSQISILSPRKQQGCWVGNSKEIWGLKYVFFKLTLGCISFEFCTKRSDFSGHSHSLSAALASNFYMFTSTGRSLFVKRLQDQLKIQFNGPKVPLKVIRLIDPQVDENEVLRSLLPFLDATFQRRPIIFHFDVTSSVSALRF